jgi:bile acid-coenzyme A ligase
MIPNGDIPAYHAGRAGSVRWALKHGDEVLTWGELDRRSGARAGALRAQGVRKDDFVTLSLPNGSELYEFTFALWKLGATPHIVSWRMPKAELDATLEVARPKLAVISDPATRAALGALPPDFGLASASDRAPQASEVATHWRAISSGGSTGRPKVIVDSAPSLADPDQTLSNLPTGAAVLNPGPLYHSAPFYITHAALFGGNPVVGMQKFDPEEALRLIEENQVAYVNLVPTMMLRIWRLPETMRDRFDLSSLRQVWHMAAPMPPWLKQAWIEWIGPAKIREIYGGAESSALTYITGEEWLEHRGSVGRPVRCQIKIVGEDGAVLAPGDVGEIFYLLETGPGSTYHYLGAVPRRTADGWESLGDFGWLDPDGYLYIADRRTDMIVAGGANIYPAEVESALMEHDGVEVAVVIGLPHEDLGAAVHAIIKMADGRSTPSERELVEFLSERLTRYKIPRSFEFATTPLRDDAGKVRRSALRAERLSRPA